MSEMARKAREANKAKAARMTRADPHQKVDASDWAPSESMNANAMTGMRPVSKRQFRRGGKVHGEKAAQRADRKPRAAGGRVDDYVNRNVRTANAELGKPHIGGFKDGGGTNFRKRMHADMETPPTHRSRKRNGGGQWIQGAIKHPGALHKELGVAKGEKIPAKKLAKAAHSDNPKLAKRARLAETLKRMHHKNGGRAHKDIGGILEALAPAALGSLAGSGKKLLGLKRGGRAHKDDGGPLADVLAQQDRRPMSPDRRRAAEAARAALGASAPTSEVNIGGGNDGGTGGGMRRGGNVDSTGMRPKGGRLPRKNGGRTKGKTNIVIAIHGAGAQPQPMPPQAMQKPPMGVPVPPPQPPPQMPPGMPLGLGAGGPQMPMPRKSGGRSIYPTIASAKRVRSPKDMDAGGLSGLGRIEKTAIAERTYVRPK